jgi:hypothetical protein
MNFDVSLFSLLLLQNELNREKISYHHDLQENI